MREYATEMVVAGLPRRQNPHQSSRCSCDQDTEQCAQLFHWNVVSLMHIFSNTSASDDIWKEKESKQEREQERGGKEGERYYIMTNHYPSLTVFLGNSLAYPIGPHQSQTEAPPGCCVQGTVGCLASLSPIAKFQMTWRRRTKHDNYLMHVR